MRIAPFACQYFHRRRVIDLLERCERLPDTFASLRLDAAAASSQNLGAAIA